MDRSTTSVMLASQDLPLLAWTVMVRPLRLSGRVRVSPWERAPQTPSVILAGVHPERGAEGGAWAETERGGSEMTHDKVSCRPLNCHGLKSCQPSFSSTSNSPPVGPGWWL